MVELRVEIVDEGDEEMRDAVVRNIERNLQVRFPDFWKNLEMKLYDLRIVPVERDSLRTARKLRRLVVLSEAPGETINERILSAELVSV